MCLFNGLCFVIGSTLVLKTIECKKYDVEAEALKLFSEDINDVVARFRRTPDYLRILNTKLESLKTSVQDMSIQTQYYFDLKLKEKVADLLGIQLSDLEDPEVVDEKEPTTKKLPRYLFRRQLDSKEKNSSQEISSQERKMRVQKLDSYHKLSSTLTLAQRNSLKDLGFEYTGHIVHSLIKSLGGSEMEERYTKLPDGGDNPDPKTPSTAHHGHEVTSAGNGTKLFFFRHGDDTTTAASANETATPLLNII